MQNLLAITKALADENRLRSLMMLRHGELCVCQIIEMLGLAPSTVSKHMSILRQAHLVDGHKQGRWMYYRLPNKSAPKVVRDSIKVVMDNLGPSSQIKKDDTKLARVLKTDKEVLCKRQIAK